MISLKNVIRETRYLLKWGGILLGILLAVFILIQLTTFVKARLFPTPPPSPDVGFGKLPTPLLFKNTKNSRLTYSIDTLTGALPSFPDRIKVYKTIPAKPALLAFEKAQRKVSDLGFRTQGIPLSSDTYKWQSQDDTNQQLTVNIFSSDFILSSLFISDFKTQSPLSPQDQKNAVETATSFVESLTALPDDLDPSKTKTSLFTVEKHNLLSVSNISQAKIIRVDFFQKDVDNLSIYYDAQTSPMSLLLGKDQNQLQVIEGNFAHQSISNNGSTYPILTANQALKQFELGNTYIVSNPQNLTSVSIKKVTLAYYLGGEKLDYLLPIVIFEDDKGFRAYVLTIKDEWVNK